MQLALADRGGLDVTDKHIDPIDDPHVDEFLLNDPMNERSKHSGLFDAPAEAGRVEERR